jgi:7-keto-8-aminopelargonate synthetase-like enzyme
MSALRRPGSGLAISQSGQRPLQVVAPPPQPDKPLRRSEDGWLDKWLRTTADLARLQYSHPMVDAVIDEIDGRLIRIGNRWLVDFVSCNYLGFDLDPEINRCDPAYLERWGTHPSWSRLLGSPVLYEEIEEKLTECWAPRTSSSCRRSPTSTPR